MKTMTCKQLGGPCDLQFHGEDANVIIKAMDAHLKEVVARGDESHKQALADMQGRWKNPLKGMGWYMNVKKMFKNLAEDNA